MKRKFFILVSAIILGYSAGIYFVVFWPESKPIDSGYQYRNIKSWMEGENAKFFYPTLKDAMKDGVIQLREYRQLQKIEDKLELEKQKTAFLEYWNSNKSRWDQGDFS